MSVVLSWFLSFLRGQLQSQLDQVETVEWIAGAYGEAGAVVTNNPALAARIRMLRDHGQEKKHHHSEIGWNARMDGFQGAVLSVKLKHLAIWNEARRKNALVS